MTPQNERDPAANDAGSDQTQQPPKVDVGPDGAAASGSTVEIGEGSEAASSGAPDEATSPNAVDPSGDQGEGADAGPGAGDDEAREPTVEERLAAAETLAAAHWDRLMRLQAEMENQRKRAQRDVGNARKFALDNIAQDLLPVKDSLELGLQAAAGEEANLESLREGSELTLKMLAQVLEKNAIVEINPEGEKFDPEFHQAMSMQSVEGVAPNTVTAVMQKGYTLNDRLIRPALVMVSR